MLAVRHTAPLVTRPIRFAAGESIYASRSYHLAASPDKAIVVRHRSPDTVVLAEVFAHPQAYAPPPPAHDLLAALDRDRGLRILDLGANIGLFAVDAFSRFSRASITSVEPHPDNFAVLRLCREMNAALTWRLVEACALAEKREVRLSGAHADAHVGANGPSVVGIDILPELSAYDYVKIDIEGSEWEILADERWSVAMANVAVLALEWHAVDGCGLSEAVRAVATSGLHVAPVGDLTRAHGFLWAWRERADELS